MPTYEYECKSCSHSFEIIQAMSDSPLKNCPKCNNEIRRLIFGGAGVIFKGSGFYVTDKSASSKSNNLKTDNSKTENTPCSTCPASSETGKCPAISRGEVSAGVGDKPSSEKAKPEIKTA